MSRRRPSKTARVSRNGSNCASIQPAPRRADRQSGRLWPKALLLLALAAVAGLAAALNWQVSAQQSPPKAAAHVQATPGQSDASNGVRPSPPSEGVSGAPLANSGRASGAPAEQSFPVDGRRAYQYLEELCALGPRFSGSPGMLKQQRLLEDHFQQQGGQVSRQTFLARHPQTGQPVTMTNLIVQWHPERPRRILLCAHYDTRPLPDRDPNPRRRLTGRFLGANDGASGTAVLMELGHLMHNIDGPYGVDMVLFDGEELVYDDRRGDPYFLGSTWFARQYAEHPPEHQYRWGVLLDMVGDADLQIYQERNSQRWRDTRPLVEQIWATAERLGVREFVPRPKHVVRDDHLPLRNIAKIPTCNIIDFDYPKAPRNRYWHTESDRPSRCSADSLAKVGSVVYAWLQSL